MPTPGNSINEATTGIAGFTGTSFVGSPATQHCVQIGSSTTSTLASVTNGTTGQFLGANTGADPTWQSVSVFPPSPNSQVAISDDFLGSYATGRTTGFVTYSNLTWGGLGTGSFNSITLSSNSGHPGLIGNSSISGSAVCTLALAPLQTSSQTFSGGTIILGGGVLNVNWVIQLNTLSNSSNRYTFSCGLSDSIEGTGSTNAVYLEYSDNLNSGNYTINTISASTKTTTNTSTAASTSFVNLGFTVNAAASSVQYFINGSSVGTIGTNIPSTGITPYISFANVAGTNAANTIYVDLFYLSQTLTTAR